METIQTQLVECKKIFSDLDTLLEEVLEGEPTPDQTANILIGIKQLHEIRLAKLERMLVNNS